MPKEYIEDRWTGHDNDEVANGSQTKVRVGWSREAEHVEVATVAPDDWPLSPTPEGNGWFVQLDRAGLNRLIRSLRKARDQAFGTDA
jgi:hypothetical protein